MQRTAIKSNIVAEIKKSVVKKTQPEKCAHDTQKNFKSKSYCVNKALIFLISDIIAPPFFLVRYGLWQACLNQKTLQMIHKKIERIKTILVLLFFLIIL